MKRGKQGIPMRSADLHIHSSHSVDGDYPPEKLVSMVKAAGLAIMAVADHNVTTAVVPAQAAGRRAGIQVLSAVELDCAYDGLNLHLLGYGIDPVDHRYRELTESRLAAEQAITERRMDLVEDLGLALDRKAVMALAREGVVISEMMAEVALEDPANAGNPLLAPYRPGGARSDNPYVNFYWDFCAPGKPAHADIDHLPLAEAIDLVTDTGGFPVLAHPGQTLGGREDVLPLLAAAGVRGLEAFSSYHSPAQCLEWLERARALNLAVTCGSDFHGKNKPAVRLGGHGGNDMILSVPFLEHA